jgi:hypothetical protein
VPVHQRPEGVCVAAARPVEKLVIVHTVNGRRRRVPGWENCGTSAEAAHHAEATAA